MVRFGRAFFAKIGVKLFDLVQLFDFLVLSRYILVGDNMNEIMKSFLYKLNLNGVVLSEITLSKTNPFTAGKNQRIYLAVLNQM